MADNNWKVQKKALQLVMLNMEEKKVEVNEESLAILEKNLQAIDAKKIAIVSVMGAFRGGKSFLLDLFLRKLRFEQKTGGPSESRPAVPERGTGAEFPLPQWIIDAGKQIEGGNDTSPNEEDGGFRFKGGMDHCTEGIWVWSEPFLRKINGETVALLLMDTQGAWDSKMTKEQSATIFGLTALISSKQIYNISQQIQEDKVENLAYFMRFAQAALRQAKPASKGGNQKDIDTPFQSLDFLVRDWANFEDEWSMKQCREQMAQHCDKHLNPAQVVENSTAEALQSMFTRINCFCLPHPGLKINKAAWTGNVDDIDADFVRFLDEYVHEVFTEGLKVKTILGTDMSAVTFPLIFRNFVKAFQDAAPVAMNFNQAMTKATVLLAKEQALESYSKKMADTAATHPRGMEVESFKALHRTLSNTVEEEYKHVTILGSDETRDEAWTAIQESLDRLYKQYFEENSRRLEKALVAFGNVALLALALFVLDRVSDWTCDWWSKTCQDLSRVMFAGYVGLGAYIGFYVYQLNNERGRFATMAAGAELWKEMMRLAQVYWELLQKAKWEDVKPLLEDASQRLSALMAGKPVDARTVSGGKKNETKKDK